MREKILNIIKQSAQAQKININLDDKTLNTEFKTLGIDSISAFKIIVDIEKAMGLQLEDSQLMQLKTINQVIEAFEAKKI